MYCIAPFSSLVIYSSGQLSPCCAYDQLDEPMVKLNPGLTMEENFNRANSKIRDRFLSDLPDEQKYKHCRLCTSMPQPAQNDLHNSAADPNIDYIKTPTLTSLHLKVSNLCNLACRTCSPGCSNLIAKEFDVAGNGIKKYEISSINSNTSSMVASLQQITKNLRMIWISGGEPFINNEVWQVLDYAYKNNFSQNIELHVNTNGTVNLNAERINILNSFKKVELHFSMDSADPELAAYIRTNVDLHQWKENILAYKKNLNSNVSMGLVYTVSVLNIHKLPDLFKMGEELGLYNIFNSVSYPVNLNIYYMNTRAKNYINDLYKEYAQTSPQIDGILTYMNSSGVRDHNEKISVVEWIDNMDNNAIKKGLYKNYKPFKEVDPFWYSMLS